MPKKSLIPKAPQAPRRISVTDLVRQIYEDADATSAYKYKRAHATNLERALIASGKSEKLAGALSDTEQQLLEADLSAIGLHPGRIQLTKPERLTIRWLLDKGKYSFGGVFPDITDISADFFSQYPLEGGRSRSGGGTIADIYLSAKASKNSKGTILAVDGVYFHSKIATSARDTAQDLVLRSKGYKVSRITDAQTEQPGVLDAFMMDLVGKKA